MNQIKIDRISKEALAVNQRIVKGLEAALSEYKSNELTARFLTVLKKHLPEADFSCWMSKEKTFNWYRIHIEPVNIHRFYVDQAATFKAEREGKDFYAVRLEDQIHICPEWRERFQYMIDRFNDLDSWEWEQSRDAYMEQFAALEQQAMEIKAKADALLESIPRPEHDPLNRWQHKSDYTLQQAFPHAFHYYGRR